ELRLDLERAERLKNDFLSTMTHEIHTPMNAILGMNDLLLGTALSPEQREAEYVRVHRAIFVIGIGWPLADGCPHGDRAPDYDDWAINGDLIYYHPELDCALEISSMGVRVDAASMFAQLSAANAMNRLELNFHQAVMRDQLPLTMGGGIGQSRLCMLLLRKAHIGEVQCSVWPEGLVCEFKEQGVPLL
ncbi:MAG: histidine kinase dimerization/phospho-acceptor domain-containing protein, partial [Eubacteriales bacterium]|nr:histidine kinase dimerization/phospho-acceptor domain-containing protein [Eubacteriales bacterium]